jgi:hypothetical protein
MLLEFMPTTGLSGCYVIGTVASATSRAKSFNEPLAEGNSRTKCVLESRSITDGWVVLGND